MNNTTKIALSIFACIGLYSCGEDESAFFNRYDNSTGNEITINGKIDHHSETRANDGGFIDQDAIGVYIVNYENGAPSELLAQGNHVTNMKFTYHEQTSNWEGTSQIFWKDKNTAVDAFSYYPFREEIVDPKAMPIAVLSRQDQDDAKTGFSNYEASDILWAKAENIQSGRSIDLKFRHLMAGVEIRLIPGVGFEESEWNTFEKSVIIKNMLSEGTVNLSSGEISNNTDTRINVIPFSKGDSYRAVILPQTSEANATLFDITVNGQSYQFKRNEATTFIDHKIHKFTIEVVKSLPIGDYQFTLVDEAVTAWEDDGISHGGQAREYIVINSPVKGELESTLNASGLDLKQIVNLKIIGEMTERDFEYLRNNVTNLEAINLKEVKLRDCRFGWDENGSEIRYDDMLPEEAFYCCKLLKHIIFPAEMKIIGENAFRGAGLIGALDIPEGVTHVCGAAFSNWEGYEGAHMYLTSLTLPSTLEYIGYMAFRNQKFNNELILPEGLKVIEGAAFEECYYMYGELHLPSSLQEIGSGCFGRMNKLTGKMVIPAGIKEINGLSGTSCTSVHLPEGLEIIGPETFWNTPIRGELHIPNTVKKIGHTAFCNTDISHIHLPEGLTEIPRNMLQDCDNLIDTLVIPSTVTQIRDNAFEGCSKLTAIILPEKLEAIGGLGYYEWISNVFAGCNSLNLLRCNAKVPPVIIGDVFAGLPKDNFTIEVPEGSVELYRNAEGWKEFKRISAYNNFVCRPQFANLLNKGHERKVVLNANGAWSVSYIPSWCNISAMSGNKKTELTITIDELPDGQGTRQDSIVFSLEGKDAITCYYVKQYDSQYKEDAPHILQSATKGSGIDLVIIGDGYDAADIATEAYLEDMKQTMEYFFGVEPYTSYRNYFNVSTVFAMSDDSGTGTLNTLRHPKFNTVIDADRIHCDAEMAMQYVSDNGNVSNKSLDETTIILMANTDMYEGLTYMYSNGSGLALCTKSQAEYPYDARGVVQHEAGGHAFGKFADEYTYHRAWIQTCPCTCCEHLDGLRNMQAMGWGQNLSISGKYKEIPWYHLVHDARYNDIVDIYEGGYFHTNGVYRSEHNSVMNNNVPYFSTWCRELIVKRIKKLAGETFDYEEFVANDNREWGRDFTIYSREPGRVPQISTRTHGNHPVIINRKPNLNKRR